MKHLPQLAERVNYVPMIAAHVTCNFAVNGIARLEMHFRGRILRRNYDDGEKACDEIASGWNGARARCNNPTEFLIIWHTKKSEIHLAKRTHDRP